MLLEEEEGGHVKFHPESKWQEPYITSDGDDGNPLSQEIQPQHGLTLYEVHRRPRVLRSSATTTYSRSLRRKIEKRSTKKGKGGDSGDSDLVVGEGLRITCEVDALLDEFRCVICFGTLRRTKIVRDCLHRFCENCVETCLRRFKTNACPVCRTEIPTRRNLTFDHVYNSLIDSLGLHDVAGEHEEGVLKRVNEAIATADSMDTELMSSPHGLQATIARKQEMRLERQRQEESSVVSGYSNGKKRKGSKEAEEERKRAAMSIPLIDLHLKPNLNEVTPLRPLELPYLRISGDATISVLESFLKQKLRLQLKVENGSIYFSTTTWRAPIPRKIQLHSLLVKNSNGSLENSITLYYRQTKYMRKENV